MKNQINEEQNRKIINYCRYVLDTHLNKEKLKEKDISIANFLSLLYCESKIKFLKTGNETITDVELENIIKNMLISIKIFKDFKIGNVTLIAIDENHNFHFKLKNKKVKKELINEK